MKAKIPQAVLAVALTHAGYLLPSKYANPVMGNFLMQGLAGKGKQPGTLLIAAVNGESGVVLTIPAKVAASGMTTIPAKDFTELVAGYPNDKEVSIELDGLHAIVQCGQFNNRLNCIDPAEFPKLPNARPKAPLTVDNSLFTQMAKAVIISAAPDMVARPMFASLLLRCSAQDKTLVMVSADGNRLSEGRVKVAGQHGAMDVIAPIASIKSLLQLTGNMEELDKVSLWAEGSRLYLQAPDIFYWTQTVQTSSGKGYPLYQTLIIDKSKADTTLKVSRAEYAQALRVIIIVAREINNSVSMIINPARSLLEMHASSSGLGFGDTALKLDKAKGAALHIAANGAYMLEALETFKGEYIDMYLGQSNSPIQLRDEQTPNLVHIVMPVVWRAPGEVIG